MTNKEVNYSIQQFEKALGRLKESVEQAADGDELKQDGAIQRFEFTFELFWKALKIYLTFLGKKKTSPREVLKEAFREQILEDEQVYLSMLEDRNICSHAYDFDTTRRIFKNIQEKYVSAMEEPIKKIKKKV